MALTTNSWSLDTTGHRHSAGDSDVCLFVRRDNNLPHTIHCLFQASRGHPEVLFPRLCVSSTDSRVDALMDKTAGPLLDMRARGSVKNTKKNHKKKAILKLRCDPRYFADGWGGRPLNLKDGFPCCSMSVLLQWDPRERSPKQFSVFLNYNEDCDMHCFSDFATAKCRYAW